MNLLLTVAILGLVLLESATSWNVRGWCPPIRIPANGYAVGSRWVGRGVLFYCRRGYLLQGVSKIKCQNIGGRPTWSTESCPTCVSIGKFCCEIMQLVISKAFLNVCTCTCVCVYMCASEYPILYIWILPQWSNGYSKVIIK